MRNKFREDRGRGRRREKGRGKEGWRGGMRSWTEMKQARVVRD